MHATIKLKAGRAKPVRAGHPWVFSGAIAAWDGPKETGATAEIFSGEGERLGLGLVDQPSALAVRMYTGPDGKELDEPLIASRLQRALRLREVVLPEAKRAETNAYRLVFSEADGLSGVVADRYHDLLAVRFTAPCLQRFAPVIVQQLAEQSGCRDVVVSVEADTHKAAPEFDADALSTTERRQVSVRENGQTFDVDLQGGQKTGFFLDQRENRRRVAAFARGRNVLSAYCYTGAFETYCAAAGAASITGIDRAENLLKQARKHVEQTGFGGTVDYIKGDVSQVLRKMRDAGRQFDLIILDPPRFVANRHQMEKGLRAYKDINLWALKLLSDEGLLATFSCSGQVSPAHFLDTVKWASLDVERPVRVVDFMDQPGDHPVLPVFPESHYLKGLIAAV